MSRTLTALRRSFFFNLLVMVSAVVLLQACGGGHKSAAPAPVPVITDPTGYYSNNGTLPALGITDLQGMVTSTRFIMTSKAQGYHYDGPITVSGNTITGNLVRFVTPGTDNFTAILSATINSDHSITGTVTHSNNHVADPFTLNYATGRANSTVAAIANTLANVNWLGTLYNDGADTLEIHLADNAGGAAALTTVTPLALNAQYQNCSFTGAITPIGGTSLYQVSFNATGAQCLALVGPYTGLAALRTQNSPNDTLVVAAYYFDTVAYSSLFGEFQ